MYDFECPDIFNLKLQALLDKGVVYMVAQNYIQISIIVMTNEGILRIGILVSGN